MYQIELCDRNREMVGAWQRFFEGLPVTILPPGDFLQESVTPPVSLVAPGNSWGIMSGGLDMVLRDRFDGLEDRVRRYHRPIAVGEAVVVPTGDKHFSSVIYAPTMETAKRVPNSANAYLAMKAALSKVYQTTRIPGFCAGVGGMAYMEVARQMRVAYDEWRE